MKAEKEAGLPIDLRTGFAISAEHGKAANELDEPSWESFYSRLRFSLRAGYPELYVSIFGAGDSPSEPD
jgi:hypothetical protein